MEPLASQPPAPAVKAVAYYLVIAFGLSWVVQIGIAGNPAGIRAVGGGLLIAAALMWPPALAAFVVRRFIEHSSLSEPGLGLGSRRYLVVAWLLPAVLTVAAMIVSLPIFPFDPTFKVLRDALEQSGQAIPIGPEVIALTQIASALTIAVPINALFAFGEEYGWRGYLMLRLVQGLGTYRGLLLHGAIWGLWHAPLIALTGYNYPTQPLLGVPLFVVFCTLLGVVFGWLQLRAGSVLASTIAHAALNAIAGLPLLVLAGVDTAVGGTMFSPVGMLPLAAFVLVLRLRGELAPRPEPGSRVEHAKAAGGPPAAD